MPADAASPHPFDDVLAANEAYAGSFDLKGLAGTAAKGLCVVTCMDSRIEPLTMLGLVPGDAKILRSAGARVTDDVLRGIVLAVNLLEVDRVLLVPHTNCRMASAPESEIRAAVAEASGHSTEGWDFLAIEDPTAAVHDDLERVRTCPLVPDGVTVAAMVYDVDTGRLRPVQG